MKKLFVFIALLLAFGIVITGTQYAYSAGTVRYFKQRITQDTDRLIFYWYGDATNGTVPMTETLESFNGYIVLAVTSPVAVSGNYPTANYDVEIYDDKNYDVMNTALYNRSSTVVEQTMPLVSNSIQNINKTSDFRHRWVSGKLKLRVTGNSQASAQGIVELYIRAKGD